jgi:uncharacterized membrane protein
MVAFKPVPGAPVAAAVEAGVVGAAVVVAGLEVAAVVGAVEEVAGVVAGVVCACCVQDDRTMATAKAMARTANEVVSKTHLFI